MDTKIQDLFGHHLTEEHRCCKLCRNSYIRDETEIGYCKLNSHASGASHPKMVSELSTCEKWEEK